MARDTRSRRTAGYVLRLMGLSALSAGAAFIVAGQSGAVQPPRFSLPDAQWADVIAILRPRPRRSTVATPPKSAAITAAIRTPVVRETSSTRTVRGRRVARPIGLGARPSV